MADEAILAKFLGLAFTVLGIGWITNSKHIKAAINDLAHQHGLQFISSLLPLIFGAYIVARQTEWQQSEMGIAVAVVGWVLFVIGVVRSWLPAVSAEQFQKWGDKIPITVQGTFVTLVGLLLLYVGYLR